jgi:hypothetical protein
VCFCRFVEFNKAALSLAEQMPNNTTKKAIMNRLLKVRRLNSCIGPHLHHVRAGLAAHSRKRLCDLGAAAGHVLPYELCPLKMPQDAVGDSTRYHTRGWMDRDLALDNSGRL